MAQNFNYPSTNYDEPYRGQFHFSPASGWMNDVNGIWYLNGTYHLSYQAVPYSVSWDGSHMHWGMATSPDLLHWTQQPIMLDPALVPGDCWSGSTVVDVDNTSGLKTGVNPVIVTIYTATTKGTCLAYSNDLGHTWQAYADNPVNVGGPNADTRDPHVFWHAPTSKWVCLLYENGTCFYTSPDLKHWSKTCHIDFGHECPDMYELPISDSLMIGGRGAHTKWVVQDASGNYLIGDFDGATFTPDAGGPYPMDVSNDFYAAQTFYRSTFPDNRVVQMAWMRRSNNVDTAPWNHNASFPVELGLKTFPEGIRLTRTPITEITKLYGKTHHIDAQTVTSGRNILAGIHSETCDIEATFDLDGATASAISFQLGDLRFLYDIAHQTLLGKKLVPLNDKLHIRILRDWGQLEVFANEGEFSYTRVVAFKPGDGDLAITVDGNIKLISADFREINRTWPGAAPKAGTIIDDADLSVAYAGDWGTDNSTFYYSRTCHFSSTKGGFFETTFDGTRVEWWGLKNVDLGKADVYIDGARVDHAVDCYSPTRTLYKLFEKSGLHKGKHTFKVVITGDKNPASTGTAIVHDYLIAHE